MEDKEYFIDETTSEPKININMRVKSGLRERLKEKMDEENKSPDDFFSDMYYAYLKTSAEKHGEIDYTPDLQDLENVIRRVVTIYKNMVERSYMHSSASKETYSKEIADLSSKLKEDYEKKIEKLNKENEKVKREYDLISEQAETLMKDTRKLRENTALIENANEKNEELLKNYKEQIAGLKALNANLEQRVENSIDKTLIDKVELEKEKALLEKDKHYQAVINELNSKYNELQLKYISEVTNKNK